MTLNLCNFVIYAYMKSNRPNCENLKQTESILLAWWYELRLFDSVLQVRAAVKATFIRQLRLASTGFSRCLWVSLR